MVLWQICEVSLLFLLLLIHLTSHPITCILLCHQPFTCRSSHLSFDIFTSLLCKCANHLSLAALYLSSNTPSENLNIFNSPTSSSASSTVYILGHPRVSGNRQASGQICSDVKPQKMASDNSLREKLPASWIVFQIRHKCATVAEHGYVQMQDLHDTKAAFNLMPFLLRLSLISFFLRPHRLMPTF